MMRKMHFENGYSERVKEIQRTGSEQEKKGIWKMKFIVLGGLATNRDPVTLRQHYFATHFYFLSFPFFLGFAQPASPEGKKKKKKS